ncbi:MAG TPA: hypothetical protein VI603_10310 [Saprospiraceae bacterium]|nr:hypothetical protein [Saprospiraceae bacterium]
MLKSFISLVLCCCIVMPLSSQSYAFGFKGGPSLTIQKWNGFGGREPLIRYHAIAFIESHNDETNSALFAQAGYHIRGSALRFYAYYDPINMRNVNARSTDMEFHNLSLSVGAKRKYDVGPGKGYYLIGLRGEYTFDTKLDGFLNTYEGLENKVLFGVLFGGGYELPFSRFVSGILEFSVSPDFSKQIYLPPQETGYTDLNGNEIILREQNVTNVSIEISLGLRFLREITYYD